MNTDTPESVPQTPAPAPAVKPVVTPLTIKPVPVAARVPAFDASPYIGKVYTKIVLEAADRADTTYRVDGYAGYRLFKGIAKPTLRIIRKNPGAIFLISAAEFLANYTLLDAGAATNTNNPVKQ